MTNTYDTLSTEQLKALREFTKDTSTFLNRSNVNHFIDYLTDLDTLSNVDLFALLNVQTQNAQAYKDSLLNRIQNANDDKIIDAAKRDLFEVNRHFDPSFVYLIDASTNELLSNGKLSGRISHLYSVSHTYEKHFLDLEVFKAALANIQNDDDYHDALNQAESLKALHLKTVGQAVDEIQTEIDELQEKSVDPDDEGNDYDYDYGYQEEFDEDLERLEYQLKNYDNFELTDIVDISNDTELAEPELIAKRITQLLTIANRIQVAFFNNQEA